MDPITSLATLVGLICSFKQEQRAQKSQSKEDFLDWLKYHRHEKIKEILINNLNLTLEVENLLKQDTEQILLRLDTIDHFLAQILSQLDGFRDLTNIVRPRSILSNQALHFLRSLVESHADQLGVIKHGRNETSIRLVPGGVIRIQEPRFVDDDLESLVDSKLVRERISSSGTRFLMITREAVSFIEAIDESSQEWRDAKLT